jgi:hypothetical protein
MKQTASLIALAACIALAVAGCGSSTTYKASVKDYNAINPADLAVTVQVTNAGSASGTPSCTIQASDPSGAYTGIDVATLQNPVAAGQTTRFVDNIFITHQGASYVTDVTVNCT